MRKFLLLCSLSLALYGANYQFNTQDLDTVHAKISSDDAIIEIKQEQRVAFNTLENSVSVDDTKDDEHKALQRDYDRLKRLQAYLLDDTTALTTKERLQDAFFSLNANKKQELSFVYALEYPSSSDYDEVYSAMKQKVSLYILQTYGVANVNFKQVMKDLALESEEINTHTIGTVEVLANKSAKNGFSYTQNLSRQTGIITFVFYPFRKIERIDSEAEQIDFSKASQDEKIAFVDLEKTQDLQEIQAFMGDSDQSMFEDYLSTYLGTEAIDIQRALKDISKKRSAYSKVAQQLFEKYPTCQNIGCLDVKLSTKLDGMNEIGGEREYLYNIKLSNDIEYSDAVYMAYRKLKRNLKHDTVLSSVDDSQQLSNNTLKRQAKKAKLTPIYKSVKVTPYYRGNSLGLQVVVKVSFEASDICSQYYVGKVFDNTLGIEFVQLKNHKGNIIEVSTTEITNTQFKSFYKKRLQGDKGCEKTFNGKKPVNCLAYEDLDSIFDQLNRSSQKYSYRVLGCEEWMFLATCGKKQKFCWGNSDNYEDYEHIRREKYGFKLKKTASKKPNTLGLYDFCGNAEEYCTNKRGWYRTVSSNRSNLEPKINKSSWADISSIRLVREEN